MTDATAMVCVGEITTPHGVRGLVRVRVFTEGAHDLFALGDLKDADGKKVVLTPQGDHKGFLIVGVQGVKDRTDADGWRGTKLFVPRSVLPEAGAGEYYLSDLEGLKAVDAEGIVVGRVRGVQDFGAGPLLDIVRQGAENLLLPFTDSFAPTVDVAAGTITVVLPTLVDGEEKPGRNADGE